MMPQQWASPCGNQCTNKYAALTQIPWRVFCKKGCNSDGDTWDELPCLNLAIEATQNAYSRSNYGFASVDDCLEECDQICYKDPVLKDQQWSAYIDRSPGAASYSEECFYACISGCGYKFDVKPEEVDKVSPNRPPKPVPVQKKPRPQPLEPIHLPEDMPGTSA